VESIDYMIVLHAEPDHCQSLGRIMDIKPDLPIYCTANGVKSIKGYHHKN
jgi:flavorubredoxin